MITQFKIEDFIPLYSDCHCLLQFTFNSFVHIENTTDEINAGDRRDRSFVKWNPRKRSEFVNYIHSDYNSTLSDALIDLDNLSSSDNISQLDINSVARRISENFTTAAKDTFGSVQRGKKKYQKENSKPWFNRKCATSRKKVS